MSIQPIQSQFVQNDVMQNPISGRGKYSFHIPSIGRKVKALALPIFLLTLASNVQGAEGGFAFFALCMAECMAATLGALAPACAAACTAILATPTP